MHVLVLWYASVFLLQLTLPPRAERLHMDGLELRGHERLTPEPREADGTYRAFRYRPL